MAKQQLQAAKKRPLHKLRYVEKERKKTTATTTQYTKKGARQTKSVNKVRHSLSSRNCKACNTLAR